MKIKKASASFGRLNGDTIEFGDGLNIVRAPNESGKSTWCAFLRTMFYGINTGERDKAGFVSDKTKYQPWNGSPMAGSMDIVSGDKEITIQRSALGRAPMKSFTAVYTGTDIPVPQLTGENAGQALLGVTAPVFERSGLIRQAGVKISQNTELEKRINAIVSSGDEMVSYTEVDAKLRSWLRKRKYNNTGSIPTLQGRIKEAEDSINALKKDAAESAKLRQETADLSSSKKLLESELEAYTLLEKAEEQENVLRARKNAEDAEKQAESAMAALGKFGSFDSGTLNAVRGDVSSLSAFEDAYHRAEATFNDAEHQVHNAQLKVNSSAFSKLSAEEAEELCANAEELEKRSVKSRRTASISTVILVILAVISAAFGFFVPISYVKYGLWALSAVLLAVMIIVNIRAANPGKQLKRLLSENGMSGTDELRRTVQNYKDTCAALDTAQSARAAAEASKSTSLDTLNARIADVIAAAQKIYPGIESVEDILPCLEKIDKAREMHAELDSRAKIARGLYESLEKSVDMTPVSKPEHMPRYTKSHTQAMFNEASRRLENTSAAYNMTLGRMRAVGDPVVLEGECLTLSRELEEQTAQYDALSLAVSALKEADTEIQTRFAPVLAKTAGTIFHRLTGGKYDMLAFDRTLDAAAQAHGETISRNVLLLSEGASNQVYLALRIAICLLAAPQDDPGPIILDDALVSFDDTRMGYALDYLKELSKTRQIILFTCQSREGEYFRGDDSVTLTAL